MNDKHYPDLNETLENDSALREEWAKLPGAVQMMIMESGMSISTLGELKMICEHLKHSGDEPIYGPGETPR